MTITLNYYRDYRTIGNIYTFCEGHVDNKEIVYSLYRQGLVINKKGYGSKIVSFNIPQPATFTVSAKIYTADRVVQELHTGDIVVESVSLLPPPPPQHVKSLKGHLALVKGKENYLEVKFYEGGLDKLKNEKKKRAPIYYCLKS